MAMCPGHELAVAVSEAGALASLPFAMLIPDSMRMELISIRGRMARPFYVNFFYHTLHAPERRA